MDAADRFAELHEVGQPQVSALGEREQYASVVVAELDRAGKQVSDRVLQINRETGGVDRKEVETELRHEEPAREMVAEPAKMVFG
jgi:hypothetical protein